VVTQQWREGFSEPFLLFFHWGGAGRCFHSEEGRTDGGGDYLGHSLGAFAIFFCFLFFLPSPRHYTAYKVPSIHRHFTLFTPYLPNLLPPYQRGITLNTNIVVPYLVELNERVAAVGSWWGVMVCLLNQAGNKKAIVRARRDNAGGRGWMIQS
jgi:hypothetical protein